MKVQFYQYNDGGMNIVLTPETIKEAANLAYFNRNATPEAKKVAPVFADHPGQKDVDATSAPIQLSIHLGVKAEKHRTSRL